MKKVLIGGLVVILAACSSEKKEEKKEEVKEETKEETSAVTYFGDTITEDGAMTPAEFQTAFEGKDSMKVKLKTTITAVCQKKGCWMDVDMADAEDMKVRFDYKFLMPLNCADMPVVIEGWAKKTVTSVADQKHYLEDANAPKEEIDAITEDKTEISFLATGVILKNE